MENYISVILNEELKKFDVSSAAIIELSDKYMPLKILGINDQEGYEAVKEARMIIKDKRIKVEKKRRDLKENHLLVNRAIDSEAERIRDMLDPIFEHLDSQKKSIDFEIKKIKSIERERERLRIQLRIDRLLSVRANIDHQMITDLTEEDFEKYFQYAKEDYEKIEKKLFEDVEKERIKIIEENKEKEKLFNEERDRQIKSNKEKELEIKIMKEENERIVNEQKNEIDRLSKFEEDKIEKTKSFKINVLNISSTKEDDNSISIENNYKIISDYFDKALKNVYLAIGEINELMKEDLFIKVFSFSEKNNEFFISKFDKILDFMEEAEVICINTIDSLRK